MRCISMVKYEDIKDIPIGSHVSFKEYEESKRGKKLRVDITDAMIQNIYPPNEPLGIDELTVMYGSDKSEQDYLALSSVNYYRLKATKQVEETQQPVIFAIGLHQYFMQCGLQELEILEVQQPFQINPNNLLNSSQNLGFSSYEVGEGFKSIKNFSKTT